jgi:hypothetical protein
MKRCELSCRFASFHEAGHAAILWMFGDADSIDFISMRPKGDARAYIQSWQINFLNYPAPVLPLIPLTRAKCMRSMMNHIAGHVAGFRVATPDESTKLSSYLIESNGCYVKEEDVLIAWRIAEWAHHGRKCHATTMWLRACRWTAEAMNHPRLWNTVEALASELQKVKTRIAGQRVRGIMREAWGNDGVPYMEMGRQWRRRFASLFKAEGKETRGGDDTEE